MQQRLNEGKTAPHFAVGDEILFRKGADPKSAPIGPVRVIHVHVMDNVAKTLVTRDKDGKENVVAVKHAIRYKRRNLSTVGLSLLALVMLLPLAFGQLNRESPLLWEPLDTPVVDGYLSYKHTVVMHNPCSVVWAPNWTSQWETETLQKIELWCKLKFEMTYTDQLRSICRTASTSLNRTQRGIFSLILGIFAILTIFSSLGSAVTSNSLAVSESNRAMIDAQRLHIEALQEENRIEHAIIKKLIEYDVNLTHRVEQVERNVKLLMADIPSIAMLTADISLSLAQLSSQTSNIVAAWKQKRLHPDFFHLHNITDLLEEGSLLSYGEPASCTLDDATGTAVFEYFLPVTAKQSKVFKANPFILFHEQTQSNKTVICETRYLGPPFVVVTNGCVHPIDADLMPSSRRVLLFPSSQACNHEPLPDATAKSWKTVRCSESPVVAAQIYFTPQLTFLYCHSLPIQLATLNTTCPSHPFSLFRTISFTLDRFRYQASSKVIEEHRFSPFDHIRINSMLFPNLSTHDFSTVPVLSKMLTELGGTARESDVPLVPVSGFWLSPFAYAVSLTVSAIGMAIGLLALFCFNRFKRLHKTRKEPHVTREEIPLSQCILQDHDEAAANERALHPLVIKSC